MLLSYIRDISANRRAGKYTSLLKIDFEPDYFRSVITSEEFTGIIGIRDMTGAMVVSTGAAGVWIQYIDNPDSERYIQYVSIGSLSGWNVMGYVDIEYIQRQLDSQRNVAILLLLLSCLLLVWLVYRLVNAIFEARFKETQISLQQKQAELSALRNQIDPHFLFNLLETVRMKLLLSGQKSHSAIIMRMARIYRKLLQWEADTITLTEEVDFIREYLNIQNYRYDEDLVWTMESEGSFADFRVPKMLLQTFVENACKHGMNENGTRIDITLQVTDNNLHFHITDNGGGFSPEEKAKVEAMLRGEFENTKGIGIANAIQRMRQYYGDAFSCLLDNAEGGGTAITAVLPRMRN
jgi:signal transduction histidine kinase